MHATCLRSIAALLLSLVLCSCEGSGSSGLISGSNEISLPNEQIISGGSPESLLLEDLNGDGVLDLVTIPTNRNTLSIVMGKAKTSSASSPFRIDMDGIPRTVAAADVNGDGHLDLVAAARPTNALDEPPNTCGSDTEHGPGLVFLFLGQGDGSFRPGARMEVCPLPRSIVVSDMDVDGRLDIVLLHERSNDLTFLAGRGDGTFDPGEPISLAEGSDEPPFTRSFAVGDLDRDGSPDVVATNNAREVIVRLGTADLTRCPIDGIDPNNVVIHDLDSNGTLDVVTANEGSADVSLLFGVGDGSLEGCSGEVRLLVGNGPSAIAVGDVNGDGFPDLVTANGQPGTVSVLLRKSDVQEDLFDPQMVFAAGGSPSSLALADVNGDAIADIVTGDEFQANATVLLGIGDGRFSAQERAALASEHETRLLMPVAIASADLNGDGTFDLVTANRESNDASILLNRGNGSFCLAGMLAVGESPIAIALADLDADGFSDLIAAIRGSGEVVVLLGRSAESSSGDPCNELPPANLDFSTPRSDLMQSYPIGEHVTALAVADVDRDGRLDLVVGDAGSKHQSGTISLLAGNGDGTFETTPPIEVSGRPYALFVADLDGESFPDLIAANRESDDLSVLLATSRHRFVETSRVAVGKGPISVVAADLDDDRNQDIVVANLDSDSISILLGRGDGTFFAPTSLAVGSQPRSATVADANSDGLMDLLVANEGSNDVSLFLGQGAGSFARQRLFRTDLGPQAVIVADLDADGVTDLAVANRTGALQGRNSVIATFFKADVGNVSVLIAR